MGLPGYSRKIKERASGAEILPLRTAPGCSDHAAHLITQLGLRVEHGADGNGVIVGPDHNETSLVATHCPFRAQPVAEHDAKREKGEDACSRRNKGPSVGMAPITADQLESDSPRSRRDENPGDLLSSLHAES